MTTLNVKVGVAILPEASTQRALLPLPLAFAKSLRLDVHLVYLIRIVGLLTSVHSFLLNQAELAFKHKMLEEVLAAMQILSVVQESVPIGLQPLKDVIAHR